MQAKIKCVISDCVHHLDWASPYCNKHTIELIGVEVKASNIPNAGNGLFATKNFRGPRKTTYSRTQGDKIVDYVGVPVNISDKDLIKSHYILGIDAHIGLDAQDPLHSSVARYANTARIPLLLQKENKTKKINENAEEIMDTKNTEQSEENKFKTPNELPSKKRTNKYKIEKDNEKESVNGNDKENDNKQVKKRKYLINNARFCVNSKAKAACLRAVRTIKIGEEILVPYSKTYTIL